MSSPTLLLSMSCGLTWAWAQREPTLYMTTSRLLQSSRSSNSLLANTVGQQVGLLISRSYPIYSEFERLRRSRKCAAFEVFIFSLTLYSNRSHREEGRAETARKQTGEGIKGFEARGISPVISWAARKANTHLQ